jgi:hypothetical protein
MRIPSLTYPGEFIQVPRWLPTSNDFHHLVGKRAFVELAFSKKFHSLEVGSFRVHGPSDHGYFAVDLAFPCPDSVTSLTHYVFHLSLDQLDRLRPVQHGRYEFTYAGVLSADHPFTASFAG